jgi:hypothetical protein
MKIVNATEYELHELIRQGLDLPEIRKRTNVTMKYLLRAFTSYIKTHATADEPLLKGKDGSYYENESEMVIPTYTYESLSEGEKMIYDKLPEIDTVGNTVVGKSLFLKRLEQASKFI